jgi:hypothetical protein
MQVKDLAGKITSAEWQLLVERAEFLVAGRTAHINTGVSLTQPPALPATPNLSITDAPGVEQASAEHDQLLGIDQVKADAEHHVGTLKSYTQQRAQERKAERDRKRREDQAKTDKKVEGDGNEPDDGGSA